MSKGVRNTIRLKGREEEKEIDLNAGKTDGNGGFSIPLSILNNIPDIGLCPLVEEANKRKKRQLVAIIFLLIAYGTFLSIVKQLGQFEVYILIK